MSALSASSTAALDTRPRQVFSATLADLAEALGAGAGETTGTIKPAGTSESADATITGITMSTDLVRPGDLYVAVAGSRTHGAHFADKALASGATAVLTDPAGVGLLPEHTPALVVSDARLGAGLVAAKLYQNPADSLTTVAITGTQGKTTTAHYVAAAAGILQSGTIGSIGTTIGPHFFPPTLTTPESPELQALFAVMREQGLTTVAIEASSHALMLGRLEGFRADSGVFLNLGHDHRDFHPTQAEYFDAKARLLTPHHSRVGIIDIDSQWGRRLAAAAEIPTITVSAAGNQADWRAENLEIRPDGARFDVRTPQGNLIAGQTHLTGAFNVSNVLAAVAALVAQGRDAHEVIAGIGTLTSVEGRLQRCDFGQPFTAIVDSAHKPEAVAAALKAVRAITPAGRVITVLGANGKRDAAKRRLMGRFAGMLSDVFIITDDNPYDDDPQEIHAALRAGAQSTVAEVLTIPDRRAAIAHAVDIARPGDTVAILGKGHERYHALAGGDIAWYDPDVLQEEINRL